MDACAPGKYSWAIPNDMRTKNSVFHLFPPSGSRDAEPDSGQELASGRRAVGGPTSESPIRWDGLFCSHSASWLAWHQFPGVQ
jgi:hypothetical protein